MDDLFAWSDVVAEVSVLRVYETIGSQLEDELIVKRKADVRIDVWRRLPNNRIGQNSGDLDLVVGRTDLDVHTVQGVHVRTA